MIRNLFILLAFVSACQAQIQNVMKKVGNRYYDHLNTNTGEQETFTVVTEYADGTPMTDEKCDGVIFRKVGGEYIELNSLDRIDIKKFGAKGNFLNDDRAAFQKAIDVCALTGRTLRVSQGKYLLNSYSAKAEVASHGGILELKSNLHIEIDGNAEIIVGNFFDDKAFVAFCGFNAFSINDFTELRNITLAGKGTISFSSETSQMRTGYKRRVAFEGGRCYNVTISNLTWRDGDLSNGIVTGSLTYGSGVNIYGNTFINLAVAPAEINHDHSTIYCNTDYSNVYGNTFIGSLTMSLIGCVTELHGSYSSFNNNIYSNYLRQNFVCSAERAVANIEIANNVGSMTSSAVWIWPEPGKTVSDVSIHGNNTSHSHVAGYSAMYNGYQGLVVFMDKGGDAARVQIKGNTCSILNNTTGDITKKAIYIQSPVSLIEVSGNTFNGHYNGFSVEKSESAVKPSLLNVVFDNNKFSELRKLVDIDASDVRYVSITRNEGLLLLDNILNMITINSTGVQSGCELWGNVYRNFLPVIEFVPLPAFKNDVTNYAKYILKDQYLIIPAIATDITKSGVVAINAVHARAGATYKFFPDFNPGELVINNTTASDTGNVAFIIHNKSGAPYPGFNLHGYIEITFN